MHFSNSIKAITKKSKILPIITLVATTVIIGAASALIHNPNSDTNVVLNNNKSIVNNLNVNNDVDIQIRNNPINSFDSLNLEDGSTNKLVLTTMTNNTDNSKSYGIGLIDKNNQFLSTWSMPQVSGVDISLNYTTDIIHGNDSTTFFVLAGISNLTKALNMVYSSYSSSAKQYDQVVVPKLVDAPSIKIFKIHTNNNQISSDINNPVYDFTYPSFITPTDKLTTGLKYFISTGIFMSSNAISMKSSLENNYYFAGYYQYLFFSQLFEYNHETNDDEFALISTYLSPDPQLGNLYAFYSTSAKTRVSALNNTDIFFTEVLEPIISDFSLDNLSYKSDSTDDVLYKVQELDGTIKNTDEPLTITTALALAFMFDFIPTTIYRGETKNVTSITSLSYIKVSHTQYSVIPGMFIYKPNKNNFVSYHYLAITSNSSASFNIWNIIVAAKYNPFYKSYDFIFANLVNQQSWTFSFRMVQFNMFANTASNYDSSSTLLSNIKSSITYNPTNQLDITQNFGALIYWKNNFVYGLVSTQETNGKILGFRNWELESYNLFDHITKPNDAYGSTTTFTKFFINEDKNLLTIINNSSISSISYPFKNSNSTTQKKLLDDTVPFSSNRFNFPVHDSSLILYQNLLMNGIEFQLNTLYNLDGIVFNISTPTLNASLIYSVEEQVSINNNNNDSSVLKIISSNEVGYQVSKNSSEFTALEKDIKNTNLLFNYTSQNLKDLFFKNQRLTGAKNDLISLGGVVTGIDDSSITISELIQYDGMTLIGFTHQDAFNFDPTNFEYYFAKYDNVFNTTAATIAYFVEPSNIIKDPQMANISIQDLVDSYQNDYKSFQNNYFNVFIINIEGLNSELRYELNILEFSDKDNYITFNVISIGNLGSIKVKVGNNIDSNPFNFEYRNVFKSVSLINENNTTNFLLLEILLPILLLIIIGTVFGIIYYRHHKLLQRRLAFNDRRMNKLVLSIKSAFERIDLGMNKIRSQQIQMLETKKPKPTQIKPTVKLLQKPSNIKFNVPPKQTIRSTTNNMNKFTMRPTNNILLKKPKQNVIKPFSQFTKNFDDSKKN